MANSWMANSWMANSWTATCLDQPGYLKCLPDLQGLQGLGAGVWGLGSKFKLQGQVAPEIGSAGKYWCHLDLSLADKDSKKDQNPSLYPTCTRFSSSFCRSQACFETCHSIPRAAAVRGLLALDADLVAVSIGCWSMSPCRLQFVLMSQSVAQSESEI